VSWNDVTLTKVGEELLSGMLNGAKLIITRAAAGDTTVNETRLPLQTEVFSPVNVPVLISGQSETEDKTGTRIDIQIRNDGVAETTRIRQVGIYARTERHDEILFGILQDEIGEEVPAYSDFSEWLIKLSIIIGISRTNNISVVVSPHVFITREGLDRTIDGHNTDENAHAELFAQVGKKVISERIRDPSKPDYGLGGGGEWSGALEVSSYSGNAEVTVVLNGTEYDGDNISRNAENAPDGTIIIKEI